MTLNELKPGTRGRVIHWHEGMPDRLLEMGLLPGTLIEVIRLAPLGGPMALKVKYGQLAIRRSEAARIVVEAV